MAENASLFWSYRELQNAIRTVSKQPAQELSLDQLALAGAGAGFLTSFVLYARWHPSVAAPIAYLCAGPPSSW